jgi:5-methyltetrahydrofolate--homocysteine methyltransferase
MRVVAGGKQSASGGPEKPADIKDFYLDPVYRSNAYRHYCETHYFMADAYPNTGADIGPGSMTLYLGGEPEFAHDTVWFRECLESAEDFSALAYNEDNKWWKLHREVMARMKEFSHNDWLVNIPDMMENVDILSAMRGPQEMCFDMADDLEKVKAGVEIIDRLYFKYFDWFYDHLKENDGTAGFTAFNVMGKGRTAKIQCDFSCDFSAMIGPEMFRKIVLPSLRKQCQNLTHSIYHLDGPDAIKHVDALMEIEELDALQWTCGAGKPDGASPQWYGIYDKARAAGKSLWLSIEDGTPRDWADSTQRILDKYGSTGIYFLYPEFNDPEDAEQLISRFN